MNWLFLIVIGLLSIVAGVFALIDPFPATLIATKLAGWLFVLIGILQIIAGVEARGWGARILGVLLGAVVLAVGLNVIGEPLAGMLKLTLIVGILFVGAGIVKLAAGLSAPGRLRWALLLSAAASLILGAMVLSNFPQSAEVVLGILLGVELIGNGIALVAFGAAARATRQPANPPPASVAVD
jgi:membrane protein HdeD